MEKKHKIMFELTLSGDDRLGEVAVFVFADASSNAHGVVGMRIKTVDFSNGVRSDHDAVPFLDVVFGIHVVVDPITEDSRVWRRIPCDLDGRRRRATQLDVGRRRYSRNTLF